MRMDCQEVVDRMAAWLDAELSPSEAELFANHLGGCAACAATMRRMEAQVFPRLALPDTRAQGFWDHLDIALDAERARATADGAGDQPQALPTAWYRRDLRVPGGMAVLYAALLLLTVGVAAYQSARLSHADASVAALELEVEREQRLAATPDPQLPIAPVGLVSHTPFRGSL